MLNMLGFYGAVQLYPDFMLLLESPVWKSSSCLSSPVIQKAVRPKLGRSTLQTTNHPLPLAFLLYQQPWSCWVKIRLSLETQNQHMEKFCKDHTQLKKMIFTV